MNLLWYLVRNVKIPVSGIITELKKGINPFAWNSNFDYKESLQVALVFYSLGSDRSLKVKNSI